GRASTAAHESDDRDPGEEPSAGGSLDHRSDRRASGWHVGRANAVAIESGSPRARAYDAPVAGAWTRSGLAERAAVPVAYVDRLIDIGILVAPSDGASFSDGDVRRVRLVRGMEGGGLPLD